MTDTLRLAVIDAAKLLGRKEYSLHEMRAVLSTRHSESVSESAVELLGGAGLLSGAGGTGSRRSTGYGVLKSRLAAKGVDASLIEILLESDLAAEVERVKDVVRTNIPGEKDKEKIGRFLEFRGIDRAVVQALIDRLH